MKKSFYLMLSLAMLLTACSNDKEMSFSDICYISNVTLGVVKRAVPFTMTDGRDTLLRSSYNGGLYPMTIDQHTLTIENRDSLLFGTDLQALLVTVGFKGSALVYRNADAGETDEWLEYNQKDSMDLSKPIHLCVIAEDLSCERIYTLKVNVHQQEGDSLVWNKMEQAEVLAGMTEMRGAVVNGKYVILGRTSAGEVKVAVRQSLIAGAQWNILPTNLPATTELEGARYQGGTLYVSTTDGDIYGSADGLAWTQVGERREGLCLAAVTEQFFYALIDGYLYRANRTGAMTWEPESLDDNPSLLPQTQLNSRYYTLESGVCCLQLMGCPQNETDSTAVVWSKTWDGVDDEPEAEWVYYLPSKDNKYQCPCLEHLTVLTYDSKGVVFGGASLPGRGSHVPFDVMLVTNDHGITWKNNESLHLPPQLKGVGGPIAAAVDDDNYIWIAAGQEIWRGRLNRLGFERQ